MADTQTISQLDVQVDRTGFFADALCTLAGGLEDAVGLRGASSFVAEVGTDLGASLSAQYEAALPPGPWTAGQLSDVLVDLKRRLGGDFRVESVTEDEIVLVNTRCPFAERVRGRPSLCMMTTTVFGTIAARATGYARVYIDKAISLGNARCRVQVRLTRDDSTEGYEFFRD